MSNDRASLQALGDQLDLDSDFAWLVEDLAEPTIASGGEGFWLVDAVRKRKQVHHFRQRFAQIMHIHLSAPEHILRQCYVARLVAIGVSPEQASSDYDRAILHENEIEARSLSLIADMQFDSSVMPLGDIAAAIGGAIEESSSS